MLCLISFQNDPTRTLQVHVGWLHSKNYGTPVLRGGFIKSRPFRILKNDSADNVTEKLLRVFLPGGKSDDGGTPVIYEEDVVAYLSGYKGNPIEFDKYEDSAVRKSSYPRLYLHTFEVK